jgi:threonine synthase
MGKGELRMEMICRSCGKVELPGLYQCQDCGGTLFAVYPSEEAAVSLKDDSQQGVWKYWRLLPRVPKHQRIDLGEGSTPLIRSRRLAKKLNVGELLFKYEGGNPTGSYKDRIAAVGVSWALANGREACIGTSSGNAGAAVAAYAARAGIPYHLFVLEHMAEAKLAQVLAYNALVRKVERFGTDPQVGDKVFHHLFAAAGRHGWEVMITAFRYNPYAMEGVKTISFELADQAGGAPCRVFVPTGGAGLYAGIWKGFDELYGRGWIAKKPELVAVQSAGCSNIARAFEAGSLTPAEGASTSQISGLQVPNPPDGGIALGMMAQGDGSAMAVADEEIWEAQRLLAEEEGLFCEPAAAASVAGLIKRCREQGGMQDEQAVCVITGVGFKDEKRLLQMVQGKQVPLLQADDLGI